MARSRDLWSSRAFMSGPARAITTATANRVFNEGFTWQHYRHTVRMGGDFRRQIYTNYCPGKLSGSNSFTGAFTSVVPNGTVGPKHLALECVDVTAEGSGRIVARSPESPGSIESPR